MPLTLLIGALYGDEGKGRVAYELSKRARLAVRFNGGANARHTVVHRGRTFELRQVPCGALHGIEALLGPGMLVQPFTLAAELANLKRAGVDVSRVRLASRATLVLPLHLEAEHRVEDRLRAQGIGTTRNGVGPALIDKVRRIALRVEDLQDRGRLREYFAARDAWEGTRTKVRQRYRFVRALLEVGRSLARRVVDGAATVHAALAAGDQVLVEGAQGTLLDVDHGAWPHVTATHPTAGGALASLGLPPRAVDRVVGVARAYATRQARGFFPTEVSGVEEGALRRATGEHALRLGWLDLVALRHAHRLNGFDELIVTGLDRLAGLPTVRLCRAYRVGRALYRDALPPRAAKVTALYQTLRGFGADPSRFLEAVEKGSGVPVLRYSAHFEGPLKVRRL